MQPDMQQPSERRLSFCPSAFFEQGFDRFSTVEFGTELADGISFCLLASTFLAVFHSPHATRVRFAWNFAGSVGFFL